MFFSKLFIFTQKEEPRDAKMVSHKLMIRASIITTASNGIFFWLPIGYRVMKKINNIICYWMNQYGCAELLCPILHDANTWKQANKYDSYGDEMLKMKDRNNNELIYGPTAEVPMFHLASRFIKTYKKLPLIVYQIHWKFRDEIRPKNGVMRSREFLMKDGYSFDTNEENAQRSYLQMFNCYVKIFDAMGLKCIYAQADAGAIGGSLTHEILLPSEEGDIVFHNDQSQFVHKNSIEELRKTQGEFFHKEGLNKQTRAIEIGHIYYFDTKYSIDLNAFFQDSNGEKQPIYGGSYGIGVSRLVAAIIEHSHDENGIIWPKNVAPFLFHIIASNQNMHIAEEIHNALNSEIVLLDDREDVSFGEKLKDADLLGMPWQIILGNNIEIKTRSDNTYKKFNNIEELLKEIKDNDQYLVNFE